MDDRPQNGPDIPELSTPIERSGPAENAAPDVSGGGSAAANASHSTDRSGQGGQAAPAEFSGPARNPGQGEHPDGVEGSGQMEPSGLDPSGPIENEPVEFPPPVQTAPEREPFWGYFDLLIFIGLSIPCMLVGFGVVKLVMWILNLRPAVATWELLLAQFAGYGVLFGALAVLLRAQYQRPFWRSLGWVTPKMSFLSIVACGVGLALGLGLLGNLIHIPQVENPLTRLLNNPTSMILIAIFGSVVAPVCEELLFRGFVQPLLVRSLGAFTGIVATALPFGLLHYQEYGNSWRHVLLITLSGVAFGWMRHSTGSTKAAAGLHAAFNGFQFVALMAAKGIGAK